MKAMLIWTINDYPAHSILFGWSGQGYKACPTCNEDTPAMRVKNKIVFVSHRPNLESNHPYRESLEFNGKVDHTSKPRKFKVADIENQLTYLLPVGNPSKNHTNVGEKRKRPPNCRHNWTKISIFRKLVYWKYLPLQHNLDVMHIEKNVLEAILDGFGSNFRHKVNKENTNITNMKSHDCHIMMQRLLPVGINAFLDETISTPIMQLCAFFKQICARELMVADMLKAQKQLIKLLCILELIYPPAFFDIMIHLVMHLPEEAIYGGPVYMRWMYPIERYMKKLKNYVYRRDLIVLTDMWTGQLGHVSFVCSTRYVNLSVKVCSNLWPGMFRINFTFKAENPNMDMKTNFPSWFTNQIRKLRSVDGSKYSDELICLSEGPVGTTNHYSVCNVNGVRFVVSNRDDRCTTQNNGIETLADAGARVSKYYGRLEDIVELH
ncbi:uncharacterized protein [Rutidosis leptorrhynchoides]|uniref:uncharacterized protein n=1 Tax=Rutidosis leptorrhynchoides TaxID=125765 RepID=UPI003A9A32D2